MHPTVKPVAMIADILRDVSDRNDIVLDGFGGSGTTLIAAEQTGRVARLLELDPLYCDVILRRFAAATASEPTLAGEPLSVVQRDRLNPGEIVGAGAAEAPPVSGRRPRRKAVSHG